MFNKSECISNAANGGREEVFTYKLNLNYKIGNTAIYLFSIFFKKAAL